MFYTLKLASTVPSLNYSKQLSLGSSLRSANTIYQAILTVSKTRSLKVIEEVPHSINCFCVGVGLT